MGKYSGRRIGVGRKFLKGYRVAEMLVVLNDCQTIPLWRNVSGDNFHPQYVIVGYTLVEGIDFQRLNQDRWFRRQNHSTGDYYAFRAVQCNGKMTDVSMAREILGLSRGTGRGRDTADHKNNDTLDNRRENLRVATWGQNQKNRKVKVGSSKRFPGIIYNGVTYQSHIKVNGKSIYFPNMPTDVEAGLMYWQAGVILNRDFAYSTIFPQEELPTEERQQELWEIVVERLRQEGVKI